MATVKTRLVLADHGRRMALDEYLECDFDPRYRIELSRGVIEVSEAPDDPHAQIVDSLHEHFSTYRRQHPGLIQRVTEASGVQLIIPELGSERNPDMGVFFRGTPRNARGRIMPRLVVEVVSPGKAARTRDYVTKAEEYLAFGIEEYGIVDPLILQVWVMSRIEAGGVASWSEQVFRGPERIESRLLPGFEATVEDLWREIGTDD